MCALHRWLLVGAGVSECIIGNSARPSTSTKPEAFFQLVSQELSQNGERDGATD